MERKQLKGQREFKSLKKSGLVSQEQGMHSSIFLSCLLKNGFFEMNECQTSTLPCAKINDFIKSSEIFSKDFENGLKSMLLRSFVKERAKLHFVKSAKRSFVNKTR